METAALVAPVTALEFFHDSFLLTGEGPILTVYSLEPLPKASASLSVLQHCRIHGIRPRCQATVPVANIHGSNSTTEPILNDLVVFGGKAVRLVRLHVDFQDGDRLHLETLSPLMELEDWALDVCGLSEDKHSPLCVALAHNGVLLLDVHTGSVLLQCSCLEGCLLYSALLLAHESWTDVVLVGGTVFNQLVIWKPGGQGESYSECSAPVERRLLGHSGVIFSISYLQENGWLASASDDRSVRVWAVGGLGGPGGKCGDLNPSCLRVLYGHQARVFSVCLCPGKVFSAGEDGACLVWDCTRGGKVVRTLKGHRAGGIRALAVSEQGGNEDRWVATGGADGGVRLWRLKEREEWKEKVEEATTENLTNLRFPCHTLPKVVCIGEADENADWSQCKFVVCTDQGTVYQYSNWQWTTVWQGTPDFQSYCVMETVSIRVKGSTANVNLCAVGNLSGSIQVFPICHPQSGSLLTGGSGKIHSLIWQEGKESMCLLASGAEGRVYRWCIEAKLNKNGSVALNVQPLPTFLLPLCAKRWLLAAVYLHSKTEEALWVCGDRRGSLLLFQEEGKPIQKRGDDSQADEGVPTDMEQSKDEEKQSDTAEDGSIMEERENDRVHELMLQPLSCLFGVHGKQGVTSVREYQGLLYSTGRDGCVRVFRIRPTGRNSAGDTMEKKEKLQLEVLRVQRACKGMEWLERVLFLEPEVPETEEVRDKHEHHCKTKHSFRGKQVKTENEEREARFVIAGFHADHFVVWDPVRQERLLAVSCGGGHRSWILWPTHKGVWSGYGALVFIKQGAVLSSQAPGKEPSCDGKTGRARGWSPREGIHGRGIVCVCRLGMIVGTGYDSEITGTMSGTERAEMERKQGCWEVVVTGGEDTSLTVLAIHPNSGNIKVLSVITDHISSVRTLTAVTRSEEADVYQAHSLSALLISAGGRAQMQCYRLLIGWDRQTLVPSCQVIQVARHRLDKHWEMRRNRHKTVKVDPETRYMSLVVVDERTDCFLLALGCSDGAVRAFSVSEVKRKFDLLWETFHHQRCVLSVATCSMADQKGNRYKLLFSAATDGKIAVWDLTDISSTSPLHCLDISAHQSGVNSIAVWLDKSRQNDGDGLVTVASGGDDGQLTVSTISVQYPDSGTTGGFSDISEQIISSETQFQRPELQLHLHSTFHIPLAHASSITAIKLLTPDLVVSTSSDQRVCLWRVCSKGISHRWTLFSHVADSAGLAVWEWGVMDKEEGGEGRDTRFENDQETATVRGQMIQTGLETVGKTTECKVAGGSHEETHTTHNCGETVEALTETCDTLCKTRDEKEGKTSHQTVTDGAVIEESVVNTETALKTCFDDREKGWVLICGQGLQLLQVKNA